MGESGFDFHRSGGIKGYRLFIAEWMMMIMMFGIMAMHVLPLTKTDRLLLTMLFWSSAVSNGSLGSAVKAVATTTSS